jgi:hypothetical protein
VQTLGCQCDISWNSELPMFAGEVVKHAHDSRCVLCMLCNCSVSCPCCAALACICLWSIRIPSLARWLMPGDQHAMLWPHHTSCVAGAASLFGVGLHADAFVVALGTATACVRAQQAPTQLPAPLTDDWSCSQICPRANTATPYLFWVVLVPHPNKPQPCPLGLMQARSETVRTPP